MKQASGAMCLVVGCCLGLSAHCARAQDVSLGLYVGAGIGSSTIRQDVELSTNHFGLVRGALGWDVFAGVRPLPYLGAEIAYLHFGSAHRSLYTPTVGASNQQSLLHESADAPAAFAVGYLPFEPWWDLYLKAGVARLHKSWSFRSPIVCDLNTCSSVPGSSAGTASRWDFAYGVGTQWKFGGTALRLEYDRVNAAGGVTGGNPDLLSVGVSWTLF